MYNLTDLMESIIAPITNNGRIMDGKRLEEVNMQLFISVSQISEI